MASFFFNLIRGSPLSPSVPDDKPAGEGICDYCGVFDATSMRWSSALTPTSPALVVPPPVPPPGTKAHKKYHAERYTPIWDNMKHRNQTGVASGFVEQHLKIKDVDEEYFRVVNAGAEKENNGRRKNRLNEKSTSSTQSRNDGDDDEEKSKGIQQQSQHQQQQQPRRPIRVVSISDTHQFHGSLSLPQGDILLVCGDVLLSDRLNPAIVSDAYVTGFIEWLDAQPHKVKIFINGNHCHQFAELGEAKIKELCVSVARKNRSVFYLEGDEIFDAFGVRFYGNSISFGNSPNKAFQNMTTLNKLKVIPYDNVIDCVKIVDDYAQQQRCAATPTETPTPTKPKIPLLPRRSDNSRAVDFLVTHSRLLGYDGDTIVKAVNPNCAHLLGHEHESHGMHLGVVDRATSWATNLQNRFLRRSAVSGLWTSFVSYYFGGRNENEDAGDNECADKRQASPILYNNAATHLFVDNLVPEINCSIVGELHRWRPTLQPPMVLDVLPYEE